VSNVRPIRAAPELDTRMYAIISNSGRWSRAALAASLTYPSNHRRTVAQWVQFIGDLDEAVTQVELLRPLRSVK
jgi:hypothetical protein